MYRKFRETGFNKVSKNIEDKLLKPGTLKNAENVNLDEVLGNINTRNGFFKIANRTSTIGRNVLFNPHIEEGTKELYSIPITDSCYYGSFLRAPNMNGGLFIFNSSTVVDTEATKIAAIWWEDMQYISDIGIAYPYAEKNLKFAYMDRQTNAAFSNMIYTFGMDGKGYKFYIDAEILEDAIAPLDTEVWKNANGATINADTGTWTSHSDMTNSTYYTNGPGQTLATYELDNNTILVVFKNKSTDGKNYIWKYDTVDDSWEIFDVLPESSDLVLASFLADGVFTVSSTHYLTFYDYINSETILNTYRFMANNSTFATIDNKYLVYGSIIYDRDSNKISYTTMFPSYLNTIITNGNEINTVVVADFKLINFFLYSKYPYTLNEQDFGRFFPPIGGGAQTDDVITEYTKSYMYKKYNITFLLNKTAAALPNHYILMYEKNRELGYLQNFKPKVGLTLADSGAAGGPGAGTYYYCYTKVTDEGESPASPVTSITMATDNKITITGFSNENYSSVLDNSVTDSRVIGYNIYRSNKDGSADSMYFLTALKVSETQFDDDVSDSILGGQLIDYIQEEMILDDEILDIELNNKRLFIITRGGKLYFSEIGNVERIEPLSYIDIPSDSSPSITAIRSYQNNLYVFKTNSIYALYGLSINDFRLENITLSNGCEYRYSITELHHILYFANSSGIFQFNGTQFQKIMEDYVEFNKILYDLATMSEGKYLIMASRETDSSLYIFHPSKMNNLVLDQLLIYNVKRQYYKYYNIANDHDFNYAFIYNDDLYVYNEKSGGLEILKNNWYSDWEGAIEAKIETRKIQPVQEVVNHIFRKFLVDGVISLDPTNVNINVEVGEHGLTTNFVQSTNNSQYIGDSEFGKSKWGLGNFYKVTDKMNVWINQMIYGETIKIFINLTTKQKQMINDIIIFYQPTKRRID